MSFEVYVRQCTDPLLRRRQAALVGFNAFVHDHRPARSLRNLRDESPPTSLNALEASKMNARHFSLANPERTPPSPALPWLTVVALVAASMQVACTSFPPPNKQVAVAIAAVDRAARAGATELAPTEMAIARDKLARAHASMVETKFERALMLAEAAEVDARLAEARARNATAAKAALTVREDNRVLRQEIQRGAAQ
jgi:hypothetical protein